MFVFNFVVESLEQSVKLGWLVIFDFFGNSFLYSPLFPSRQPKRGAFYSVFVVRAVFSYKIVVSVAKENLLKTPAIVSLADFQHVQMLRHPRIESTLAICEFL